MAESPRIGDTRIVREKYARTPDGLMWLQNDVLTRPGIGPIGTHCPRCAHWNDVGADACDHCGKGLEDATTLDALRCPKCDWLFRDVDEFRDHYGPRHLDGAPVPEAIVQRARARARGPDG